MLQIVAEALLRAEVALRSAVLTYDEAGELRPMAFDVLGIDAVVTDLRVSHRDNLPAVTGVGEDLLVARHRRVETDLAVDLAIRADGSPCKNSSVFEGKFCRIRHE